MPVSAPELLEQTLPNTVYPQLSLSIANMVRFVPGVTKLLTDTDLPEISERLSRFTVLTSKSFSVLICEMIDQDAPECKLTFAPNIIAGFLNALYQQCQPYPHLHLLITPVIERQAHKTNDARLQGQFTLQVLAILGTNVHSGAISLSNPPRAEVASAPQLTPNDLINQIATQIRQGLDLPLILSAVVEETCRYLQVDRLIIYQLPACSGDSSLTSQANEYRSLAAAGSVTYEALASSHISSVLHYKENLCGSSSTDFLKKFHQGHTLAISDIQQQYAASECWLTFLPSLQVRALLVTPILIKSGLWGLLIAHQCSSPRQWHSHEQDLLTQIAAQLAIAIYQSHLHAQVQQQQQTLEEQVTQRTQELHTALMAAQSANQAKSDFLATMNHELRTPLTCVIGMSATLLRWSLGPLTDKQRSCLQTIHDSGEHLLELINDILDFSHVQSGKATLNLSEFSLTTLMQQILQMMRDKADAHQVQLKANLKIPQERDRFIADLRRVQQILISLIDNAIKFTPMGGKVTLRVWVETNTVVFQVEDTGIGISSNQLPYLFEKFQQLEASYHRTYEGAGLGLALAQQCVTLHQGWIDVSSVEGQGSIFTVQLPNQSALFQQQSSSQQPLSAGRIVLIEGNEEEATLLCDMLTAANYQVIWMVEASAAIDQIRLLQPIAVIVDAQLPAQGCLNLIRRLRELPGTNQIKIIVLTLEGVSKDHQRYLSLGADAYLLKSLKPEDLLRKVDVLLKSASVI